MRQKLIRLKKVLLLPIAAKNKACREKEQGFAQENTTQQNGDIQKERWRFCCANSQTERMRSADLGLRGAG